MCIRDSLCSLQRLLAGQGDSSAFCIHHVVLRTFAYRRSVGVSQFHVGEHVGGHACLRAWLGRPSGCCCRAGGARVSPSVSCAQHVGLH
eukprot:9839327-Alexandrium_andersonii.AAC.1